MVDDRAPFVLTLALTVLGLAAILYGVLLNYGASINGPMIVGGVLLLLGIGVGHAFESGGRQDAACRSPRRVTRPGRVTHDSGPPEGFRFVR